MGKAAARIGDQFTCQAVTPPALPGVDPAPRLAAPPPTPPIPHVGGIISLFAAGVKSVLIGGRPAAVVGDGCVCMGGMHRNSIEEGSSSVLIGGKAAARMGDSTSKKFPHSPGGEIMEGCSSVEIGD